MKKTVCILLSLFVILSLSSCSEHKYRTDGLKNYSPNDSDFELSKYLFPCENFIEKFEYVDGNYYNDCWDYVTYARDKSFAYFKYTSEVYQEVFIFTQNNMSFVEENTHEFNGYTFIQQDVTALIKKSPSFPHWFWMMFYSEERHVIGFLGYYHAVSQQKIRADEDFEGFIRYEFSNYDWDAQYFSLLIMK